MKGPIAALLLLAFATAPHSVVAGEKKWKHEKSWKIGAWSITRQWDDFENHYSLIAYGEKEAKDGPSLLFNCTDGDFTIDLLGLSNDHDASKLYGVIVLSDKNLTIGLPAKADTPYFVTISAKAAEYMISNSHRIGLRLKFLGQDDRDYFYRVGNLAAGKPQLFNICRPL